MDAEKIPDILDSISYEVSVFFFSITDIYLFTQHKS